MRSKLVKFLSVVVIDVVVVFIVPYFFTRALFNSITPIRVLQMKPWLIVISIWIGVMVLVGMLREMGRGVLVEHIKWILSEIPLAAFFVVSHLSFEICWHNNILRPVIIVQLDTFKCHYILNLKKIPLRWAPFYAELRNYRQISQEKKTRRPILFAQQC